MSLLWCGDFRASPINQVPAEAFLFPYVMVGVNTVFYGVLIYLCLIIGKRWARR